MFGINPLANLLINIVVNSQRANQQIRQTHTLLEKMAIRGRAFGNIFNFVAAGYSLIQYVRLLEKLETGFIRVERVSNDLRGSGGRGSLFNLADEISGSSIYDIQEIARISGQLGIRGKENLLEFTRTIAIMANVTGESANQLATDLGKILQVFSLLPTDVERVSNAILQVSDDFNATSAEITNIVRRIGAFAKTIGLSSAETIAFAGAMKDTGVNTEIAASSLYTFFARLQTNPVSIAKLFGMKDKEEIFQFFKKLRTEPVAAITELLEKIKELSPAERLFFFKELELYGVRNAAALGTLAEKVDRLKEALVSSNKGISENVRLLQNQLAVTSSLRGRLDDLGDSWRRFLFTFSNTGLIKSSINLITDSLVGLEFAIRRMQGLNLDIDFDLNQLDNKDAINARLQKLNRQLWELKQFRNVKGGFDLFGKFEPNTIGDEALLKIPGVRAYMQELNMMKSQGQFIRLSKEIGLLTKILERLIEEQKLKEERKKPDDNTLRQEFQVILDQETKGKGRGDGFGGFLGLTEAWKAFVLDSHEGIMPKLHQEVVAIHNTIRGKGQPQNFPARDPNKPLARQGEDTERWLRIRQKQFGHGEDVQRWLDERDKKAINAPKHGPAMMDFLKRQSEKAKLPKHETDVHRFLRERAEEERILNDIHGVAQEQEGHLGQILDTLKNRTFATTLA